MSRLYRLIRAARAGDAFSGEGARLYGGRWNPPGHPAVYTSQSRALAVLEMFVHLTLEARSMHFLIYEITLPKAARLKRYDGPAHVWRQPQPSNESQEAGRAWLADGKTLGFVVPSVIVPHEANYVLNPRHPQFARLHISKPEVFSFDPRLWKS